MSDQQWRDEFLRILKTRAPSCADQARALVAAHVPPRLYRYKPFNEYMLSELRDGRVWLSPAEKFNDPFECGLFVDYADPVLKQLKMSLLRKALPPGLDAAAAAHLLRAQSLEEYFLEGIRLATNVSPEEPPNTHMRLDGRAMHGSSLASAASPKSSARR